MALGTRCLRVAMLNADTSLPNVYANLGTFGDILHRKLTAAADRTYGGLSITHSVYNVVVGEYPDSLDDWDAVFVTASAASSYDEEAWVKRLEEYILMVYAAHPKIKLFGSCFGHHLICQALLRDHGVRVAKRPGGWEIGVNQFEFTAEFRESFAQHGLPPTNKTYLRLADRLPTPESESDGDDGDKTYCSREYAGRSIAEKAYLEFVHADEVVLPSPGFKLPKPWMLLGSTEHCEVPGVYQPGRVLTLQGHFEFDSFKSQETMRIFGADESSKSEAGEVQGTVEPPGQECDDGEAVVDILVQFLVEGGTARKLRHEEPGVGADLPTP